MLNRITVTVDFSQVQPQILCTDPGGLAHLWRIRNGFIMGPGRIVRLTDLKTLPVHFKRVPAAVAGPKRDATEEE